MVGREGRGKRWYTVREGGGAVSSEGWGREWAVREGEREW